jgi:hypothetical protein
MELFQSNIDRFIADEWLEPIHRARDETKLLHADMVLTWFPLSDQQSRQARVDFVDALFRRPVDMEILVIAPCDGEVECPCQQVLQELEHEMEEGETNEDGEDLLHLQGQRQRMHTAYRPDPPFSPSTGVYVPLGDRTWSVQPEAPSSPARGGFSPAWSMPAVSPLSSLPWGPLDEAPAVGPLPLNSRLYAPPLPRTEADLIQRWLEIARQVPGAEAAGVERILTRMWERELRGNMEPELGLAEAIVDAGLDMDWLWICGLWPEDTSRFPLPT